MSHTCAVFYKFWFWVLLLCHFLEAGLLRVPSPVVYLTIYIALDSCLCTSYLGKSGHFSIFRIAIFFFVSGWTQRCWEWFDSYRAEFKEPDETQIPYSCTIFPPSFDSLYLISKFKIFSNFSYVLYFGLSITLYLFLNIRVICDYFIY